MLMPSTILPRCLYQAFTHDVNLTGRGRSFADHVRSPKPLSPAIPKNRIKSPTRGGRNLRDRYLALEKSLRGKEALTRGRNHQQQTSAANTSDNPTWNHPSSKNPMFKGFVVPNEPLPPASDECCMSGCAVCVYDLYEESLEAFEEAVEILRKNLVAINIHEHEWPKHIQTKTRGGLNAQSAKSGSVVMSVFEEMERRLKEKHAVQETKTTTTNPPSS